MKSFRRVAGFFLLVLSAQAQELRRAQPATEPPPPRALPVDAAAPSPSADASPAQAPSSPEAPADKRQLNYANALFGRRMYDLAVPEYEKYLSDYAAGTDQANALFGLGESYRQLGKSSLARTNFQRLLKDYPDSEFAGPAAYALAVLAFGQKDYEVAQPLFHRAAAKAKDDSVALSARYFEARCLESLKRGDDALPLYLQVAETKSLYRDDARATAGAMLLARGRRTDALKQYEALSTEAEKSALRAEAAVRAGLIAVDLATADRGKTNKEMAEKARVLLLKGKAAPEAGRWKAIAQAGLLRLEYQSGQFAQLVADYQKTASQLPEDAKPEALLLVGNAERQLGHPEEAENHYHEIIEKYPNREEAKDARYQRLINIYNSDPAAVVAEVDAFLQTTPTQERMDQAKLLKAEALYQQQKYADAAPIYEELRSSQLATKLRAEAAYKLGWCYIQSKDSARVIEAFSYFIKAFPDDPQAASALVQRARSFQESRNLDAAVADLSSLISNYPDAREREAALQQKALLLGRLGRDPEMTKTFQLLLKEYPKSTAAAQANYFIGKAAFDAKEFKRAIAPLENARKLDRTQYYDLATSRIILSYFQLRDRKATAAEADAALAANAANCVLPEVLHWLGVNYYNEKNYPVAVKYFTALGEKKDLGDVKPDFWFYLGDAAFRLKDFDKAAGAYSNYLQVSSDPAGKAKAMLALGTTKIAANQPDDAEKIATEIMQMQPEGRVNAEARLLAGDAQFARQHYAEAAKAYAGVALLYDDPSITPVALDRAADSYHRAGMQAEADRFAKQLRDRFPNYGG